MRFCEECRSDDVRRRTEKAQSSRIAYVLRAARDGRELRFQKQNAFGAWKGANASDRRPTDPLSIWVAAILHETGMGETRLGEIFGTHERFVRTLRDCTYPSVGLQIADRSLCSYAKPVRIDGEWLYERLVSEAKALPGNGQRLLRYIDRAERVAHMADTDVEFLWDLWPELAA
jgi:hypothetical protein